MVQDEYNEAFAPPEFALAQRVADLMLVCCVALMFGSGMPFCYLIALVVVLATAYAERWAIMRLCAVSSRYAHQLPGLVIGELCCSGNCKLWCNGITVNRLKC
jgi:hypothetical protein